MELLRPEVSPLLPVQRAPRGSPPKQSPERELVQATSRLPPAGRLFPQSLMLGECGQTVRSAQNLKRARVFVLARQRTPESRQSRIVMMWPWVNLERTREEAHVGLRCPTWFASVLQQVPRIPQRVLWESLVEVFP